MPSRPPPPEPYETWLDWVVLFGPPDGWCAAELAELRAERDHWKANHDEMVARNATLRNRRADDETLKLQNIVLRAEIERLKAEPRTCLVCGVIMHEPTPDPADEYLRTAKASEEIAREVT